MDRPLRRLLPRRHLVAGPAAGAAVIFVGRARRARRRAVLRMLSALSKPDAPSDTGAAPEPRARPAPDANPPPSTPSEPLPSQPDLAQYGECAGRPYLI